MIVALWALLLLVPLAVAEPQPFDGSPAASSSTITTTTTVDPSISEQQVANSDQPKQLDTQQSNTNEDNEDDSNGQPLNSPHERLWAVRNLLGSSEADQQSTGGPPEPAQLQCSHKGRHFREGQQVPIEEQPCLNCTCRRAVLQCFLRVCPPVVSLEAHRRRQLQPSARCGPVKVTGQCCPTIKCEGDPEAGPLEAPAETLASNNINSTARDTGHHQQSTPTGGGLDQVDPLVAQHSIRMEQTNRTQAEPQLPKLTVISSLSGQRDSILLITSNPQGHQHSTTGGGPSLQRSRNSSSALVEALLETVYSQRQLATGTGSHLQGSCMINGSLYVEGSAVIPEGNAYCQYCYCIRQKVMCVKPKCHLIISGCSPKYSNEFACCPTSYSCPPAADPPSSLVQAHLSRLDLQQPQGRLSALVEAALARLIRADEQPSGRINGHQASPEAVSARQVDPGPVEVSTTTTTMTGTDRSIVELLSAMLFGTGSESGREANSTATSELATTSPAAATTTTTSTTTSTSTSTSTTTTTTPAPSAAGEDESNEAAGEDEADDEPSTGGSGRAKLARGRNSTTTTSTSTTTTTTRKPSAADSVADFLEPMNKLGPMVVAPTTPAGCLENGRTYGIGEQIPTLESCKHCYCGPEGLKECRMVECSLRAAHNCRPVTPEGHCCPIRFDCPPLNSTDPSKTSGRHLDSLANFEGLIQCRSADGLSNDCASRAPTTTGGDSSLEEAPLLKSTRLIDGDDSRSESPPPPPMITTTGSPGGDPTSAKANLSLSEELSKFIMQIKASNRSGSEASADYHSVQAEPPAEIPKGMFGIPSIEPEPVRNLLLAGEQPLVPLPPADESGRSVEPGAAHAQPNFGPSRSEDMMRSLEPFAGLISHADEANATASTGGHSDNKPPAGAEPELSTAVNLADDYADTLDGQGRAPQNASELPHVRLLRNHHSSPVLEAPPSPTGGSPPSMVVFDDELSHSIVSAARLAAAAVLNQTGSVDLTTTEGPADVASTPQPPQPTTGTPFGLEADRTASPARNSWLKPLPNWIRTFGQRLSGAELQGAASAGPLADPTMQQVAPVGRSAGPSEGWSARAAPLLSVFKSIIATAAEPTTTGGGGGAGEVVETQAKAARLTMRPLAKVLVEQPVDHLKASTRAHPPYEPSQSPSELEIVTAAIPSDPEMFGQKPAPRNHQTKELVVVASSSFARRSDVELGPELGERPEVVQGRRDQAGALNDSARSVSSLSPVNSSPPKQFKFDAASNSLQNESAGQLQQVASRVASQQQLSCFDPATNRTYQPNERIARDDPCETCTCLLGQELCQTLVCPERPADDCREERQPGQCCPNYLCGQQLALATRPPAGGQQQVSQAARAGLRSMQPAEGVQNPDAARPSGQRPQADRRQTLGPNQSQRQLLPLLQRLPQQPLRASELANILPAHLRFRQPTGTAQTGQLQSAGQLLSFDQSRLLFPWAQPPQLQRHSNSEQPHSQRALQPLDHQNHPPSGQRVPTSSLHELLNQRAFNPVAGSSLVRPSMLLHPPRFSQHPMRRNDEPPIQQAAGNHLMSFPMGLQPVSPAPAPSGNNLLPSQAPPTLRQVASTTADGQQLDGGWQQPKNRILMPPMTPVGEHLLGQPQLVAASRASPKPVAVERVLFQQSQPQEGPISSFGLSPNQLDSGFRPLLQVTGRATSITPESTSPSPSTMAPEVQQSTITTTTTTTATATSSPSSSPSTSSGRPETEPEVQTPTSGPASGSSESQESVETTSTPTTTTTEEPSTTAADGEPAGSTGAPPVDYTKPDPKASESSPDEALFSDLFRVSECDIYGKLYRVGQPIEELSSKCKSCTCTSTGVDCTSKC